MKHMDIVEKNSKEVTIRLNTIEVITFTKSLLENLLEDNSVKKSYRTQVEYIYECFVEASKLSSAPLDLSLSLDDAGILFSLIKNAKEMTDNLSTENRENFMLNIATAEA